MIAEGRRPVRENIQVNGAQTIAGTLPNSQANEYAANPVPCRKARREVRLYSSA
jgi:hypothetical protein